MVTEKGYAQKIALWGGVEATINRVGDRFYDQCDLNGHHGRPDDFDRFAVLGIKALRLPILWETTMPSGPESADWSYADLAMDKLDQLQMEPIVGLCHHGSGPAHTNLLDRQFPEKLAAYARLVAERFPRAAMYTPVNEPLTTARFSALYGHWYPHHQDGASFVDALLNQCKATVLAMRAIRGINPDAKLVQTEDLGKVYSTPKLAYQAKFENERRWLSWDLLCGRVHRQHPLWRYLLSHGATVERLDWHLENACPPDIIGINHYVSSERFLDDRLHLHVPSDIGGNGRDIYADVLAARVRLEGCAGFLGMIREAWERYGIPVAITECHMGCSREEQLRWVAQAWDEAHQAAAEGVEVVGFTLWSLLGSFDWNSLLTRFDEHYEPGVFDLRSPKPRPTAIAQMAKAMARGERPSHPVLDTPGWWKRPSRLRHEPVADNAECPTERSDPDVAGRPVLILGNSRHLGPAIAAECAHRGLAHHLMTLQGTNSSTSANLEWILDSLDPWAVINVDSVDRFEEGELSVRPEVLVAECSVREIELVQFSTAEALFEGISNDEDSARVMHQDTLVIRTSELFGFEGDLPQQVFRALSAGGTFRAAKTTTISPTYLPDLVNAMLDLLIDGEKGVWCLTNLGCLSEFDFACEVAKRAGLTPEGIKPRPDEPRRSLALTSNRGWIMPTLGNALDRYLQSLPEGLAAHAQFAFVY